MSEVTEVTEVVSVEQEQIVLPQRYKIYVVDITSRMHTIRINNGLIFNVPGNQSVIITHDNALEFHDVFIETLYNHDLFSFKNEKCVMIFKTKDLVGIQIIPEEY